MGDSNSTVCCVYMLASSTEKKISGYPHNPHLCRNNLLCVILIINNVFYVFTCMSIMYLLIVNVIWRALRMGLQVPLALLPYGYCMPNKLSVDMAIVGTVNNIISKSRSNKGSTHYVGDIEFCFIAKVLSRSFHSFGTFVVT